MRREVVFAFVAIASSACSEPLEFADWTIPVPEGTRVIEYAHVPIAARTQRIELVEDLVIGADATDPNYIFYRARDLAVDPSGHIFVLDRGGRRIQVFDANGAYLRTLGQEGQGPGELENPSGLLVTRDRVVVKASARRLSSWRLDGEHVADIRLANSLSGMVGTDDGIVASYRTWLGELVASAPPSRRWTFALYGTDGEREIVYAELDQPPPKPLDYDGPGADFLAGVLLQQGGVIPTFVPQFTASRDGTFYLTTGEEYQVRAFGSRRWAMRVAWVRDPVTGADVDNIMARHASGRLAEMDESALEWPESFPAITGLEIDGHGHIYVYPFYRPVDAPSAPGAEPPVVADRPVDVFSADGEHLFSGMISVWNWGGGAQGGFIYQTRLSEETDEYEVVRYRLVEPFE